MIKLTVRQMEYVQALAETGHFGRAAAMVGISQPALSVQIAEMEQRLSCRLFERRRGGVTPSEAALALLPRIERILAEIRELEILARRGQAPMEGRFRLGIIPTVAPYLLPRLLPALRQRFPRLQIELKEAVTGNLVEETTAGTLDAFVAALPIDHGGLATQALFEDRFFLAVSADDDSIASPPIAPESPVLERLMLLEEGHCLREQALAVCGRVKPVAMARYGATSLTTLLQMVAHGMGVTLVPEMAADTAAETRNLRVVPFTHPVPARTICLAWRRNGSREEECRLIGNVIAQLQIGQPASDAATEGGQ